VLDLMQRGDHAGVIDNMPTYRKAYPEGHFGHYLMMAAAMGGVDCTAPGELFSEYEASVGTGQVHVWFERPEQGWSGAAA
jgi:aromatic ring-opening dioxygenase catalytic subunit (LigB family)